MPAVNLLLDEFVVTTCCLSEYKLHFSLKTHGLSTSPLLSTPIGTGLVADHVATSATWKSHHSSTSDSGTNVKGSLGSWGGSSTEHRGVDFAVI